MAEPQIGTVPQWLQFLLGALSGSVLAALALIRLVFSFNTRLQRIENQELDQIIDARIEAWSERRTAARHEQIDARISRDWHDNRYPMLQTRVFAELDKLEARQHELATSGRVQHLEDELKAQGQNIAILLERDRTAQAIDRLGDRITARLTPP